MREHLPQASASVDWRDRVVVFLAFLTSEDCRAACRKHARPEELAAALSRLWFDEIYVPGESYLFGLKGDRSAEQIAAFQTCFSLTELKSLERFHGFFELRLDFVTNNALGRAFFPENDSWRSILQHASYVLAELDPDPNRLRSLLAAILTEADAPEALVDTIRRPLLLEKSR